MTDQTSAQLRDELLRLIGQQVVLNINLHSAVRYLAQGLPFDADKLDELQVQNDAMIILVESALARCPAENTDDANILGRAR